MKTDIIFSKKNDEWETPDYIFKELDNEFHFDLDPCATAESHKCEKYFTKEQDGLSQKWGGTEYSVIHHTAKYRLGCKSVMRNQKSQEHFAFC